VRKKWNCKKRNRESILGRCPKTRKGMIPLTSKLKVFASFFQKRRKSFDFDGGFGITPDCIPFSKTFL
jgi:hypothetical protein